MNGEKQVAIISDAASTGTYSTHVGAWGWEAGRYAPETVSVKQVRPGGKRQGINMQATSSMPGSSTKAEASAWWWTSLNIPDSLEGQVSTLRILVGDKNCSNLYDYKS